jgi:transcription elongation GreA/GreB family factor
MDADAAQGRLSMDSPFANALRGCRAGDVATVPTPRGPRRWRVVSVA